MADRASRARLEELARVLGTLPVDSVLLPAAGAAGPAPVTARGRCLLPSLVARGRRLIAMRCWRGPGDTGLRVAVSDEVVSADLAPDEELRALATDYYQKRQQTVLPTLAPLGAEGPGGATDLPLVLRVSEGTAYVPALGCGLCHPAQLERWRNTAHARAVQALDEAKRELPECLRCHSTLFAFAGELEAPPDAPGGVECASCHGDGRRHLATRLPKDVVAAVPANRCARCHTAEESPRFSDEYRSRPTCAESAVEEVEP